MNASNTLEICVSFLPVQPKPVQRPPSTVGSLLQMHGLQQFTDVLISNGYDDIQFLAEVPDEELEEIGISPLHRQKVSLICFHAHFDKETHIHTQTAACYLFSVRSEVTSPFELDTHTSTFFFSFILSSFPHSSILDEYFLIFKSS